MEENTCLNQQAPPASVRPRNLLSESEQRVTGRSLRFNRAGFYPCRKTACSGHAVEAQLNEPLHPAPEIICRVQPSIESKITVSNMPTLSHIVPQACCCCCCR